MTISAYTVWDKYAVSVVHISSILLDLLGKPSSGLVIDSSSLAPTNRHTKILG